MDIKIQPKALPKIEGANPGQEMSVQSIQEVSATNAGDPITAIATDLVEGKIDTTQAVDLLIEQTMNADMVAAAPPQLRAEVEQVLRTTIETDPYLISLTQKL